MISGGEIKSKITNPYSVQPLDGIGGFGIVTEGTSKGEYIGGCSEYSGTKALAGVTLSQGEAAKLREELDIAMEHLHLNNKKMKEGSYCFYYKDLALRNEWAENLSCSIFGEGTWNHFVGNWLPFTESTRCEKVKKALLGQEYEEPTSVLLIPVSVTVGLFTLVAGGVGFFWGGDLYNTYKAKRAAKKAAKKKDKNKNDDDMKPGGGGTPTGILLANASGKVTGTHIFSGGSDAAMSILAGAQSYLSKPDVQADLKGLKDATVVTAPAGVAVPAGNVVVSISNKLYFVPKTAIAIPKVNLGAIVKVPIKVAVPVKITVAP